MHHRLLRHILLLGRVVAAVYLCVFSCFAFGQVPDNPIELWNHVTVYRDEWGVPHVFADSLRALGFGFGYAQADDHIVQMMTAYRVASGRAAEILGESYAASDELALMMGHLDLARELYPALDPATRELCEGFALGVNAWIVDWRGRVPEWVDGVKPEEVLALMHCYLMSFAPLDLSGVFRRAPGTPSANAWALSPSRTNSGGAILVMNPHADYASPFQWYEAHLVCPGINIYGATLFGLPVILQGHNGFLAWAISPNQPDFADVYIEKEPKFPVSPKMIGGTELEKKFQAFMMSRVQPRTFYVKTPRGLQRRHVSRFYTPRGPVISRKEGNFYSYLVGGYPDFGSIAQFLQMASSNNLPSFLGALSLHQLPCFHIVYADREGNIAYFYNTKTGFRSVRHLPPTEGQAEGKQPVISITAWDKPLPSDDLRYAWGQIMPFSILPAAINPESGFVQACGTTPWGAASSSKISPDNYPNWLVRDRDSYRARRVRHLLGMGTRSYVEVQSMVYDVLVPFAASAIPKLLEIADQRQDVVKNLHPDLPAALELLRKWSCVAETNSPAMTFFHVWWSSYRNLTPGFEEETDRYDAFCSGQMNPQLALDAAAQAVRLMRNEFHTISVPWGNVHAVSRGERTEPIAGGSTGDPLFYVADLSFRAGTWQTNGGFGFAMVVNLGQQTQAVSMLPFGVSEFPNSPHFADQLDLLLNRRFKLTRFVPEQVQRYVSSALGRNITLLPQGIEGICRLRAPSPVQIVAKTSATAPSSLPENLSPYTMFLHLEQTPQEVDVLVEAQWHIPPELCPDEQFQFLRVYMNTEKNKWVVVPAQNSDEKTRMISFRGTCRNSYVVLGPGVDEGVAQTPSEQPQKETSRESSSTSQQREDRGSQDIPNNESNDSNRPSSSTSEDEKSSTLSKGDNAIINPQSSRPRDVVAWGEKIDLKSVDGAGEIQFVFEREVGVRLSVASAVPAALPEGLQIFSDCYYVTCSDPTVKGEGKVTLKTSSIPEKTQNVHNVQIFGWNDSTGWTALDTEWPRDMPGIATARTPVIYKAYVLLGSTSGS
ncbi:MAG TPA: penicillin acylase family protein [Candidatus Hydrogenedentes bacterium]|nr:penicillin acylase family protein [Candidatus Hydrogenedentota bacterium]HOL76620.1 penicillin acylase family protein [Candidatus Hydrogenedentota bacterium]HPO84453.1 penicillin acylase family protein [Candidatus Hydrogenedentota bacterium]